jgi:hypothetical protein
MLLSVERPFVGAFAFHIPRATLLHCDGQVRAVLPASTEHEQTDNWDSPGTCEVLSFPQRDPGWSYRVTNSRPWQRTRLPGNEKNE